MTRLPRSPGFMVVHGNHPESLRDLLLAWFRRHPPAPLEDEVVLVQSNGVAQWLKLSLALPLARGGLGIAAALKTQLPSQFTWEAYRAVLGAHAVPAQSPFDEQQLVWRLVRLLPERIEEAPFEPLRRFLQHDADGRKLFQLAARVADLFDQYQVYRADWLAAWSQGRDEIATSRGGPQPVPAELQWQPHLWRLLLQDVGGAGAASSRAEVHRRFLEAAQAESTEVPAGLPRRVSVFGVSSLPQQGLEVLAALARWTQVLLCVHNPCEHDWSHIVADQDLLRATRTRQQRRPGTRGEDPESLHLQAHPLLAAWGKQGRDFIRLLDAHDERERYEQRFAEIGHRVDLFEAEPGATRLLRQLQDDVRDLRPLAETRTQWPPVDAAVDRSLVFHVAHGPQREVEVLHDEILAALHADPALRPRDIIVMVPDVSVYAPHIQAVFGRFDRNDRRFVPFSVADRTRRQHDPLLAAVAQLLALPQSRLPVSEVLDLLEVPAVRQRFGIEEDDVPLLHRWIAAARIRWGLHAEHRASLALPAGLEQNSWRFGLRRMLLGYAVGSGAPWEGIAPMDEIGGLDAALLGPLVRLLDTLDAHWRALAEPAAPQEWGTRLRALLDAFFEAKEGSDEGYTLLRLQASLDDWVKACAAAELRERLALPVVREHWLGRMEQPRLGQPFFGGGVTFASLMPMRAIPFRWIALLGMNDGDYPRTRTPMDFDLMAHDWRPGDRSRREDDRYLFLEALLSARDHLHVSWVGRSIHDNEPRPPSVLVAQLRDHLKAGWRLADGKPLLAALTVEHRLQPFHPDYFDGSRPHLFSHAHEWQASLAAAAPTEVEAPDLATPDRPQPLALHELARFAEKPVREFFQERLSVHLALEEAEEEDHEPFTTGQLANWKLQDELIQVQRAAFDAGADRQAALAEQLARMRARGELPVGEFARREEALLAEPMDDLFRHYQEALERWPQALPDLALTAEVPGDGGPLVLEDWLDGLRTDAEGRRARLVLTSTGLTEGKFRRWRHDKLLKHWVAHVAGHLQGEPLTSVIVSKAGCATLLPLAVDQARTWWAHLLRAWEEGMRRPLPFAVGSACAWVKKSNDPEQAQDAARDSYDGGFFTRAESRDPYLARAFPDFDALWADGEFATWAERLLKPLIDNIGNSAPKGYGE